MGKWSKAWNGVIVTFRKEGVDWNTQAAAVVRVPLSSPSVRKVWIEIVDGGETYNGLDVTFRKEGVDWNNCGNWKSCWCKPVTFRKEGVDWNMNICYYDIWIIVTFRKEGVDWNLFALSQ